MEFKAKIIILDRIVLVKFIFLHRMMKNIYLKKDIAEQKVDNFF